MAFRVAIASSDGEYVDGHFGRARQFLVFELKDNEFQFIEKKDNSISHQGHQENVLINTVELLANYDLVMANKIGLISRIMLKDKGIQSIVFEGSIEEGLGRISKACENRIFIKKKHLIACVSNHC